MAYFPAISASTAAASWCAWYGLARKRFGFSGESRKMSAPTVPLTSRIFWPGLRRRNFSISLHAVQAVHRKIRS